MTAKNDQSTSPLDAPAPGRGLASEVVAAVGDQKLLDIKFWIEPSSATRDEILGAAREWIVNAERDIKQSPTAPLS